MGDINRRRGDKETRVGREKVFSFCVVREVRKVGRSRRKGRRWRKDSQGPIKIDHWIFIIGRRGEAMRWPLRPSCTRLDAPRRGGWWWFGTHNPSICHDTIIAVPWCSWRAIHGETNGRARVHAFARQNRGEGQGRGKAKSTKANRPMLLFQRVLGEIVGTAITISLENYSKYDGNILALAETYVFVRTRIRESLKFIGLSVAIYRSVGRAGVRWKGDRAADS